MEVKKQLNEIKRALVVIDMVEGFTREGVFANQYAISLIPECVRLTKEFLSEGDLVIATKENHTQDSTEFKTFPKHCIKGTSEWELVKELAPFESQMEMVYKNSTCAAVTPKYIELMTSLKKLEELVFIGVCRDICVIQAAITTKCLFNELNRDVNVIVPENATDTYDASWHNRDEWNEMSSKFMTQAGIEVVKKYERRK